LLPHSLAGELIHLPNSLLVGELDLWTEAATRTVATRGWQCVHLFDAVRIGGRHVGHLPYRTRRDLLWRGQSQVECYGPSLPWYRDRNGDAHDRTTGRYVKERDRGWRLAPIVPQRSARLADSAWQDWVHAVGGEGVVAVNLDAPLGARKSKLKCKPVDTLDAVVLSVASKTVCLEWRGHRFTCTRVKRAPCSAGDIVEVCHAGWYESSITPRFATILRVRADLH